MPLGGAAPGLLFNEGATDMSFDTNGRLHTKGETVQITERFRKREFVLELAGKYPQFVQFQLTGDRCGELDEFEVGQDVKVKFSLSGREWTNPETGVARYFNSLDVWVVRAEGPAPEKQAAPPPDDSSEPPIDGDVPF